MYNTFIEFVQHKPEGLSPLGIFPANLTERFCQNNAVQLTFKVTLQTKLFYQNARSYFNSCRPSWLPNG